MTADDKKVLKSITGKLGRIISTDIPKISDEGTQAMVADVCGQVKKVFTEIVNFPASKEIVEQNNE